MSPVRLTVTIPSILAILLAVGATSTPGEVITDITQLRDVDVSGLSEAQKALTLRLMNDNPCNCGCKMTIAVCRLSQNLWHVQV